MISQKRYNLVFYGEIASGHPVEEVKRKLSARFNLNMSAIARVFTGKPVRIKANVDYKTALKYQISLEWVGVLCQIEPISNESAEYFFEDRQPGHVNVIFDGKIAERYSVAEVKRNLRGLLKLNAHRIEELFAGHPVVVMKDVDYHPALKIQTSFELAGAICRIEAVEQSAPEKTVEQVPSGEIVPQSPSETMTCLKCGFVQRKFRKCSRCGMYVETYLKGSEVPKTRRAKQFAQKIDAAMQKELFNWGIGLIILGIIQLMGLWTWAFGIVSLGILNLLVRRRTLFIVNGITAVASGVLSLVRMTLNALFTPGEFVVNAGAESVGLLFMLLLSGIQIYVGFRAFNRFKKYSS